LEVAVDEKAGLKKKKEGVTYRVTKVGLADLGGRKRIKDM